jgi:methylated-DNA-protein-cysteine methyltransferase-like protein
MGRGSGRVRPKPFTEEAARVVLAIPSGRVASYGQVARLAGDPRAARQVVRVLNTMSDRLRLPWHRVVNRQGRIALPAGHGFELQRRLLLDEGIEVGPDGTIDLERFGWREGTDRRGA